MYDSGNCTIQQIADDVGVTRPTIYRHLSKTQHPVPRTVVNPQYAILERRTPRW
jgi:DNA-binding phage protein